MYHKSLDICLGDAVSFIIMKNHCLSGAHENPVHSMKVLYSLSNGIH